MRQSKKRHSETDASDYQIGYGKPPKHSQFRPGQSGFRRGRPKGARNFKTDVKATLKAPVRLTRDGQPRSVSTQEAMLLRLREKALGGDGRALDRLIQLAQVYGEDDLATAAAVLFTEDENVLQHYRMRVLTGATAVTDLAPNNGQSSECRDSRRPTAATEAAETTPIKRVQVKRYRPADQKRSTKGSNK